MPDRLFPPCSKQPRMLAETAEAFRMLIETARRKIMAAFERLKFTDRIYTAAGRREGLTAFGTPRLFPHVHRITSAEPENNKQTMAALSVHPGNNQLHRSLPRHACW